MKKCFTFVAWFAVVTAWLTLTGCDRSPSAKETNTDPSGLGAAQQHAAKTIDAAAINKAIELFYVQTGRFPTNLTELASQNFVPEIPTLPEGLHWDYDATVGVARISKSNAGETKSP